MIINQIIANELQANIEQIDAAVNLLDQGATVPFIARYRKEITGGLNDIQLRHLATRLVYLRELQERKAVILKNIDEQGKLTRELENAIVRVDNKTALEDLYLPFKPKRRTKAHIAREQGLQLLADKLLSQPNLSPEVEARAFVNDQVVDIKVALDGARAILIEQFGEDAALLKQLRKKLWNQAKIHVRVIANKEQIGEKFRDYFDYIENIKTIPSHRALAILRGRNEGILQISLKYQDDEMPITEQSEYEKMICQHVNIEDKNRSVNKWLRDTVRLAWRTKIFLSLELDALSRLKEQADNEAIFVFTKNLKDLLLAAPAGRLPVLGLDPGFRTGIKIAVVDDTGKLVDSGVIYLNQPVEALAKLADLINIHKVQLIAIGNGTASRETDKLIADLVRKYPEYSLQKMVISEAGASVYSASELAAKEFPDLDVSLRGAISIARRLQDPLAELVKIDPKSIGVGQYQHDVNQHLLAKSLDAVVEDCVNAVGVDVNIASAALLSQVSGLNYTLAHNIVAYRDEYGAFTNRKQLLKVPRLGAKTFEQAAGFLRIQGGTEPLDASAVHPEAYEIVEKILKQQNMSAKELIGNHEKIAQIKVMDFVDERFGIPTILDILSELEKPGRDPRGEFKTASFSDEINEIKDLKVGMILEGVVSNVAAFGAFVDIGVHQDGLVHISALSNQYVNNPRDIVKAGDVVKVKVLEVDIVRKRIALTMRLDEDIKILKHIEKKQNNHLNDKSPMNLAMEQALQRLN